MTETVRYAPLVDRIGGPGAAAWDIHFRAQARKEAGEDIILLTVGDPDFDTPATITDVAVASMRGGRTHYTPSGGEIELRRAVAAHHQRLHGQPTGCEQVVIVPGAQCGLFAAALCLLGPGDEVIVPEPTYVTYAGVIGATGATPVNIPLSPERDFHPDPADVAAAVSDRTRAILLNSPHNPTGVVFRRPELEAIVEICRRYDLWLISDEVYASLTFERPHVSPCSLPEMAARTVVASSPSKSHAMTGWRIGWVVAPVEIAAHMTNLMACMLYGSPPFIQDAAVHALTTEVEGLESMRAAFRARRDLVCDTLARTPGMTLHRPESGMFVMIDVRGTGLSAQDFAEGLLAREGVSVLPADPFGPSATGHVRLSFSSGDAELAEGCRRIVRYAHAIDGQAPEAARAG